jgi:type I restriction enzyme S subunit
VRPGYLCPKGYKQTGVGVIPEDWEVKRIGDVFNVAAGGDFDDSRSSSIQDERHPFPIYSNALGSLGLYGYCEYADHAADSIAVTARGLVGAAR